MLQVERKYTFLICTPKECNIFMRDIIEIWNTELAPYVIMTTMASKITNLTIVYWTVFFRRRSKKTSKLRVTGRWIPRSNGQ